jgi:hypothetical protein
MANKIARVFMCPVCLAGPRTGKGAAEALFAYSAENGWHNLINMLSLPLLYICTRSSAG